MKKMNIKLIVVVLSMLFFQSATYAWSLHTLIADPVFSGMSEVTNQDSVTVTSLEDFLKAVETELAEVLSQEEQWARDNLVWYMPLPTELRFEATGNEADLRQRFISAIRINPESKLISYLQLLPGESLGLNPRLPAGEITPLKAIHYLENVTFVSLSNGSQIDPLSVLVSANDEPDMGLDVGLYENNQTSFGERYGLGIQPFGNPNLEYGSQAPIHMGLYHEAKLVNKLAPYISHCLPEYRIHLYKTLSEFAFKMGQDYWGWRFMGWGLHYIADLAQPYHSSALPGVSVIKMMTMNTLDMLGRSKMKSQAIQLVSNRHTAIESLERQLLERAYLAQNSQYMHFETLRAEVSVPEYGDNIPRAALAMKSNRQAKQLDRVIEKNMPERLVSDPDFELGNSPVQDEILHTIEEADHTAVAHLEQELNGLLGLFSTYGRSYVLSILSAN